MNSPFGQNRVHGTPVSIARWQFEESLNGLRRTVDDRSINAHWQTTGVQSIDATARAHIGEWRALDVQRASIEGRAWPSVIDSVVHRALQEAFWDLYVVEATDGDTVCVRGLRDQRGVAIQWLEGRRPPATGSTVALRLIYLDPPGLWASTLPVVFGHQGGAGEVISALLRAFGSHKTRSWAQFMSDVGARIVVEYGLAHLRHQSHAGPARSVNDDLRELDAAFRRLESALFDPRPDAPVVRRKIGLDDGQIGWIEDMAAGPQLLIFGSEDDYRRYRNTVGPGQYCDWRRVYRATPEQLSVPEAALARRAGLNPEQDGMVRLERRNGRGHFVDADGDDRRSVKRVCQALVGPRRRKVA